MPSTETLPRPPVAEDEPPGLHLSATQVVASALAAVTATLAASYLGVAGTLIGAAVASVVTVVGNTLYSHSIARTRDRMRATLQNGRRAPAPAPARAPRVGLLRRIGGWRMVAAAGAVFAVLLGVMATVGLVAGRPVTAIVRNEPAHTAPTVSSTPTPTSPSTHSSSATSTATSVAPTTASPSETSAPSSSPSADATSPAAAQSGSVAQTQTASP